MVQYRVIAISYIVDVSGLYAAGKQCLWYKSNSVPVCITSTPSCYFPIYVPMFDLVFFTGKKTFSLEHQAHMSAYPGLAEISAPDGS